LDDVERKLSADDLMICDAEKPMCIAGVLVVLNQVLAHLPKIYF
jgi:phenylalanyl-tRNA synthetase beta subunit